LIFFASTGSKPHLLVIVAGRFAKTEDFCGQNEASSCFSSVLSGGFVARAAVDVTWSRFPSEADRPVA
jgi:hypothetical protein